jgi:Nucleoside-diphosphate-sugar pyrophosphorylase involved in lipopolysaccharide biosynthesis/translation initiation factor 2B, gamma/epsilon subunits (eIF-2Bgamma/eIF-2Bepsilon)
LDVERWAFFFLVNEVTQAFVLAAGLGMRLRPLTDELPKPLIPIFQKPLLTFALDHLIGVGVNRFVINTHRHPQLFEDFFAAREYAGFPITLVHEPDLLETGGGIKNAESHLASPAGAGFLTYSSDILADVELQPLIDEHFRRRNDVTLALRHTGLAAAVALRDQRVVDISNRYGVAGNFDFANIAVWNSAIFERIPPRKKISFIPIIGDWIGQGAKIGGVVMDDGKWFNIGSRAEYLEVHRTILRENWKPDFVKTREWPERKASSSIVDSSAQLRGCTVVGQNCRVGADAILEDTILWPDAEIASQSRLEACIVRSRKKVTGIHHGIDI